MHADGPVLALPARARACLCTRARAASIGAAGHHHHRISVRHVHVRARALQYLVRAACVLSYVMHAQAARCLRLPATITGPSVVAMTWAWLLLLLLWCVVASGTACQ